MRRQVIAGCGIAIVLGGCGSGSPPTNTHSQSATGVRATIRGAEADLRAGRYAAFCGRLTASARSLIDASFKGKSCAQIVGERAAQEKGKFPGSLKPNSRIVVSGDRATVYSGNETTGLRYTGGRWELEESVEVTP